MYQFNTLGATNVVASYGVDNGIFAWLDGTYEFGVRGPGSVNGDTVQISADTLVPGPPPTIPEPATYTLFLIGTATLAIRHCHRLACKAAGPR